MSNTPEISVDVIPARVNGDCSDHQPDKNQPAGLRFRRLLPLGQLFLCAVLLFPYRGLILFEVFGIRFAGGLPPSTITQNLDGTLNWRPNGAFERWFEAKDNAFDLVSALNLPAAFVADLPYSILSNDHGYWSPGRIDYKTWRAVTWPLIALPLWWMAGRGLEALQSARRKLISPRIGWTATVISFLLMAGGLTLAVGFFFSGADRADHQFRIFIAGAGAWGVLGSFTVMAKLAQWGIKRRSSTCLRAEARR